MQRKTLYLTGALVLAIVTSVGLIFFGLQANQAASENATLAAQNAPIADTAQAAQGEAIARAATAEAAMQATQEPVNIARSRELAAQSQLVAGEYPIRSLLLAVESQKSASKTAQHISLAGQALRDALANPLGIPLSGHEGPVTALAFSPSGRWLATGSYDHTVQVWDMESLSTEPTVLRGHEGPIITLAFSPDEKWLATGSADKTARVWDMTNLSAEPMVLRGHENPITALAFSPDGKWLVTGSGGTPHDPRRDNIVRVWDMDNLAGSMALDEHYRYITTLAFSSDGKWLAVGSQDTTIHVWDMANLETGPTVLGWNNYIIFALALSPDGRWLVTSSWDNTARVWDMGNLKAQSTVLRGHSSDILTLAISPDGHWLATGGNDRTARVWNMDVSDLVARACELAGHNLIQAEWERYFPGEAYRKTCEQWEEEK